MNQAAISLSDTQLSAEDRRSRWLDGLVASLTFLGIVAALIVATILAKRAGPVVLLVETAVMLALALFCLLRGLDEGRTAVHQAWYGILSGFFAWTALEAGALLGQLAIETESPLPSTMGAMRSALCSANWRLKPSAVSFCLWCWEALSWLSPAAADCL